MKTVAAFLGVGLVFDGCCLLAAIAFGPHDTVEWLWRARMEYPTVGPALLCFFAWRRIRRRRRGAIVTA